MFSPNAISSLFQVPSLAAAAVLLLMAGCDATAPESNGPLFEATNTLESRMTSLGGEENARTADATLAKAEGITVKAVHQVEPPTVHNGDIARASHLYYNDKDEYIYVGYKLRGSEYGGGIDIIDAEDPSELESMNSLASEDFDVNEVSYNDDADALYAAGAVDVGARTKGYDSPAALAKMDLSGSDASVATTRDLPAYVVKSVAATKEHVFAATDSSSEGASAVLELTPGDLRETGRHEFPDAELRSLDIDKDRVYAMDRSGKVYRSVRDEKEDGTELEESTFFDATIGPGAISRIRIYKDRLYAALNEQGFVVYDTKKGARLHKVPDRYFASVSTEKEKEQGRVYAARPNGEFEVFEWDSEELVKTNSFVLSELDGELSNAQVNQIMATKDYLYVANSTGGLIVLEIEESK